MTGAKVTTENLDPHVAGVIRERAAERARHEDIAVELGVSVRTVRRYMRLLGIRYVVDGVSDADFVRMFDEGMSIAGMAESTGLAAKTVKSRLKALGLKRTYSDGGSMRAGALSGRTDAARPNVWYSERETPLPREDGMFAPVEVSGDGPLARRYRKQLEERSRMLRELHETFNG